MVKRLLSLSRVRELVKNEQDYIGRKRERERRRKKGRKKEREKEIEEGGKEGVEVARNDEVG